MAAALDRPAEDIRVRMDRVYRPQRHVYDLTRRPYLLGRDRLIAGLGAKLR
jgi:S-adenosylmethionine-diacylgycerolhomoserine-N-methlytransferase